MGQLRRPSSQAMPNTCTEKKHKLEKKLVSFLPSSNALDRIRDRQ